MVRKNIEKIFKKVTKKKLSGLKLRLSPQKCKMNYVNKLY